jgi:hypothetical protein
MATFYINALVDLGPDQYPKARAAIDEIFSWGQAPGVLRRPMSDVPTDFLPEAVATALRSLRHDPGYFMPQRGGGRTNVHGGRERVFEEVLALDDPARTRDLASVLAEIAQDETGSPQNRWRAAYHLAAQEIAGFAERPACTVPVWAGAVVYGLCSSVVRHVNGRVLAAG